MQTPKPQEVPEHFHRLKRKRETISLAIAPSIKRALVRLHRQQRSWRSVAVIVEALVVRYLRLKPHERAQYLQGNYYDRHDSRVGRDHRQHHAAKMAAFLSGRIPSFHVDANANIAAGNPISYDQGGYRIVFVDTPIRRHGRTVPMWFDADSRLITVHAATEGERTAFAAAFDIGYQVGGCRIPAAQDDNDSADWWKEDDR